MIDPGGRGVVDVGTDHGFVPVRLALSGYPGTIIASDVNRDPLSAAVRYAEEMNVADQIDFRLSDGLQGCCYQEVDTVVIAGMGGDLICSILDEAGAFHRSDIVFILQPMTKIEILRYFLVNNGWVIYEESTVSENGKLFHILKANYQGLLLRTDSYRNPFLEDWELYTGKEELLCKSIYCTETLLQSRKILEKRLYGKDAAYFQSIFDNLKMMMERTAYGG